ncbi:hypothetical protein NMG29_17815 [Streptomyces cocklensis]|uniref:Lipoprotein n=1 Tax=Actinacidiphila cocklensis TaxID=887465 RepID=A0A9W4GNR3_9ACTN|nr:hypothetical protein [Actinacidiphila cocklensis]MDD1060031.1 hypothetical protein [Actinacidiphila cocklensis]CAG6391603.1 conserved hypothetical protein [Actinacidiphila cocklensis]
MIPEAAARLSRRSVVAAAVVAVGAGCGKDADGPSGGQVGKAPAVLPGVAEQAAAVHDSTELIGRYDAAAAAHPSLAARLRPLRAEVVRHVEAFGGKAPARSPAPAAAAGGTPAQALAALAAAERALADRRAAAVLAVPGELARLMASVAAAGAGHAALLGTPAGGKDGR